MTPEQLNTIQESQAAYFAEVVDVETGQQRGVYNQVFESEGLGYCVHTYDGPAGKGFVVMETQIVEGITQIKATNFGNETCRAHDWIEISG